MFASLALLIEDAKKWIPVSSRRSWTAKNSLLTFSNGSEISRAQLDTGFKNVRYICQRIQTKALGNKIGSSWGMAQRFTRRTRDLDTIRTATHYTYKKHYRCTNLLVRNIHRSHLHSTTRTHHNTCTRHKSLWGMAYYFFDARNLNLRAPLIYNLVCPCSLTTSYVILRGKNSCSAVLSCQLGFSRTKKFDSKRNQKKIFRIATYSCRENESSMTHVEEE